MAQERRKPAEVFPPGFFVEEELQARGWTQADLAEILGRPIQLVNEVISAKRSITAETARGLGDAFDTGPEVWMNLDAAYQLWRNPVARDDTVSRRARLYGKAPVKDMIRRRWIEPSNNVEVLEQRILSFLEIKTLDESPQIWPHAAKKMTSYEHVSHPECAWLFRARRLARGIPAAPFTDARHEQALESLRSLLLDPESVRHIPTVLAECGIRLLVIEPLPRMRMDGVTFWLDEKSPVIAITMRYDRIDWFWHTLLHEMKHVSQRDGLNSPGTIDVLFASHAESITDKPASEKAIDAYAANFLVPKASLENFVSRVRPLYSKLKIKGFAAVAKVHPGLVVGQLQRRKEISYSHNREMLAKVRELLTGSTLTDGWGKTAPVL